ncbi:HTH-type transcriptional regulator GltC [Candidatus Phycosocius bacilliformis]|uniref:HTH-type transcriptional regulator GltC n=1 Tax=Candidatus Phycosocius bacilliformis TaxID=1445552 RepID=A0A2P2E9P4_9PROT|nr:LysR family transcriptional regulator [Candidatus Phycosocius bacilliformis]GBF57787.1 HTH-type transcriptional regulator GltC [Candidatus Phycosocius bacilliformis]
MEMQQVRYFISVAKWLNFTRAAEECHVTQPALTRAIKLLEQELGGDLIRREGRHTHLTELGNKMLPILCQCHEAALAAKSLASQVRSGELSTLSVAVSHSVDLTLFIDALRELRAAFPGIQIKLKRGPAGDIGELLKSGKADVAICGPLSLAWDRLEIWPLFNEPFEVIVGSNHALADSSPSQLALDALTNTQFTVMSGLDLTLQERDNLRALGIDLASAHEVASIDDMKSLLTAGLGLALAPAHILREPTMQHVSIPSLQLTQAVAVCVVSGRHRNPEANALLNLLRMKDWQSEENPVEADRLPA